MKELQRDPVIKAIELVMTRQPTEATSLSFMVKHSNKLIPNLWF